MDSSALVKVYVREAGRELVERAVDVSSGIATAMISYVELGAAFARLLRERSLTEDEHERLVGALDEGWRTYDKPAVAIGLMRIAGDFAQRFALRGYDAVQLASATVSAEENEDLRFLAFDNDLNEAARQVTTLYEYGGTS